MFLMLVCLFAPCGTRAQSLERGKEEIAARQREYNKKVNFGIKGGFRSTNYIVSSLLVDGQKIEDTQKNYKLGYYGTFFARINFKRQFFQTEISYNIDRAEVVFDKGSTATNGKAMADVSSDVQTIGVPLMYGHYIVRNGPYALSVFLGPKLEYVLKSDIQYNNFDQQNIHETLHPFNIAVVGGISVSISRVFFDFRYEQEMMNISKSVSYTKEGISGPIQGDIKFHRRGSSLSFSFGVVF